MQRLAENRGGKMNLKQALENIKPICSQSVKLSQEKWNNIAKPLYSLGKQEILVNQLAGIYRSTDFTLDKCTVAVMCADNGVVAQKVTQTDSVVTAVVAESMSKGTSPVCIMAKTINTDILPIDIGIARPMNIPGLLDRKIMPGTNDISQGPAMAREQAIKAVEVGIETALNLKEQGCKIIATGEMGIGNTTTSAAMAAVLLGQSVDVVTGLGAGLDKSGYNQKVKIVEQAIQINQPNPEDPLDVLAKVGGLDIAGIVGLFIGGAAVGLPVIIDGVISSIAALTACRMSPTAKEYMLASHISAEPAASLILQELQLLPFLDCNMRLGEGTGAVAALGVLKMAVNVYNTAATFADIDISKYKDFN